MGQQPTLVTKRLILRPYNLNDAPELQQLIGDRDVAAPMLNIPHPYEDGMAEEWISAQQDSFEKGEKVNFAITHREHGFFIGGISLTIEKQHESAELGYWIGEPYWNQGFCTEAAKAALKFGFETVGLNRVQARHFVSNPASGRVMQNIGMIREGCLRQNVKRWGEFQDSEVYGILSSEFAASQ